MDMMNFLKNITVTKKLRLVCAYQCAFCPRRNLQFRGGLLFDMADVVCVSVCVSVCVCVPGQTLLLGNF